MELPHQYYVGEEFIKDSNKIRASIYCCFRFLAPIAEEYFEINGSKVSIFYDRGHLLTIKTSRELSSLLLESLKKENDSVRFIIGYIDEILPIVNELVNRQKYSDGHLLNRMFSTLDITDLFIEYDSSKEVIWLQWPPIVTTFPPSAELAEMEDHVFIRDYIDAMTMYYTYDFDNCIRNLITSLENYFHFLHLQGSFKSKLNMCLNKKYYINQWGKYLEILKRNVEFIYKIRNSVVHNKFRLPYTDRDICIKGIGTLSYVYQSSLLKQQTVNYIFSLARQFLFLEEVCCGLNLDYMVLPDSDSEPKIITSSEDMDDLMFSGLKIEEAIMESINERLS